jgi:hypothetical protein
MKKGILALLLASLILSAGCSKKDETVLEEPAVDEAVVEQHETETPVTPTSPTVQERLEGLTQNEYDGIEMTAAILPRMAILPGSTIPVTVTVQNTGDKTVVYTQGSGSFTTPQALLAETHGLQPILPQDHLGIATMDFAVRELQPGEQLQFVVYVRAIEPHAEFDTYSRELYNAGESAYIGDLGWDALYERHNTLVPVQAGAYESRIYFTYYVLEESAEPNLTAAPTGYAFADLSIQVTDDTAAGAESNPDTAPTEASATK